MRRLTLGLIVLLCLAVGGAGCLVHVSSTRREGKSCGAGKVWTKRGKKWKCKKAHRDRGKHKGKKKGKDKGVRTRDHRK